LENFDKAGRYRSTDDGHPECPIDGNGEVAGVGSFRGPAGLADLLTASGQLEPCIVTQVFRFASGRRETTAEQALLDSLKQSFQDNHRSFRELLLALVSDPNFAFRAEE
jgi:hypothetical protein